MSKWIDFKELRTKLSFADLLRLYKVDTKPRGAQLVGLCPLPSHEGKGTSPSFSVNVERGIFHCFSCGGKGNVLDFAGLMEGVDIRDGSAMRRIAEKMQSVLLGSGAQTVFQPSRTPATVAPAATGDLPVVINFRAVQTRGRIWSPIGLRRLLKLDVLSCNKNFNCLWCPANSNTTCDSC